MKSKCCVQLIKCLKSNQNYLVNIFQLQDCSTFFLLFFSWLDLCRNRCCIIPLLFLFCLKQKNVTWMCGFPIHNDIGRVLREKEAKDNYHTFSLFINKFIFVHVGFSFCRVYTKIVFIPNRFIQLKSIGICMNLYILQHSFCHTFA